jgi:hypothetical protein
MKLKPGDRLDCSFVYGDEEGDFYNGPCTVYWVSGNEANMKLPDGALLIADLTTLCLHSINGEAPETNGESNGNHRIRHANPEPTNGNLRESCRSLVDALPPPPNPILFGVLEDLLERARVGHRKYGTLLYPHNGRSALKDAYEEILDLAMYLKQKMVEEEK